MNYFLMIVILGLCGGGYYEYTTLQQNCAADQQQVTDLSAKVDALQAENKKLDDDKAQLAKAVTDAQTEVADLTKQEQTAQSALANARQQVLQPAKPTPPPAPTPAVPSNNLGTVATLDGKTFPNCQLLKVQADGIVINYSGGITQISYAVMPPELQKRFGYDPRQAAALTEAQTEFQEEERKAAAQAAGN